MGNPYLLNPEWSTLRKLLVLQGGAGGKLTETEITGNPVAFNTNVAKALTAFTIPFLPVQSGTGDPSPDNIRPITGWTGVTAYRTGKNIFPLDNLSRGYINSSGTFDSQTANILSDYIPYVYGQKITAYIDDMSTEKVTSLGVAYYDAEKNYIGRDSQGTKNVPYTFSVYSGQGFGYIRIWINRDNEEHSIDEFKSFGLYAQFGDDFTAYSPYTGQSYPVTFPATGKNLLPPMASGSKNEVSISVSDDGTITINGTANTDTYFDCDFEARWEQGNSINFLAFNPVASESNRLSLFVITDKGNPQVNLNSANAKSVGTASAVTTASRLRLRIPSGVQYTDFVIKPMLQIGGTEPTAYEPFTNTIYGGTLDLTTGVLTVDMASITFDGSNDEDWSYYSIATGNLFRYFLNRRKQGALSGSSSIVSCCNSFSKSINESTGRTNGHYSGANKNTDFVYDDCTDLTSWRAYLASNPIQLVYELETPLVYQLTPTEILSLVGDNTIWTDTNGENTIKYQKKG